MTKRKTTKRALLLSALSVLMCVSMLVGTTYAWFTDSVSSANNKIQAGNLDVQLWMHTGTDYEDISESEQPIFGEGSLAGENILWEPGKTEIVYLAVKNNGSLALKYNILVDVTDEGLVGSLKYAILDGVTKDDADASGIDSWGDVIALDGVQTGDIASGRTVAAENGALKSQNWDYFALAIHMDELAGNEYQNKNVVIDIQILATQLEYESDSFGDDYDASLDLSDEGISRTLDDGSTVFYGDDGYVTLTALPENLGNEYTVPADVNNLGSALGGVTLDKLTIPAGVSYARKSLMGANVKEIVVEDGATTIPDRMFYQANVENIVIPDSVTTIAENAFSMSKAKTLTIPASVTTIEEAAFQHMDNLETVVIEGNAAIQGYAFRGCDVLRNVYLNGEDVTFVKSTLHGYNSTWFCNGESNNKGTSNINFYVKNDTVAENLRTALGAELPETTPIYVNGILSGVVAVSDFASLKSALATGEKTVQIVGVIDLTESLSATDVTFLGVGEDAGINFNGNNITGANAITYKKLNLTTVALSEGSERDGWHGGIDYLGHAVANYEDCSITGVFTTYSKTVNATRCTFNYYVQGSEEYYGLWLYTSGVVNAADCTFMYGDRAIKLFSEGVSNFELNINGGAFVATEGYTINKALINFDGASTAKITVNGVSIDEKLAGANLHNAAGNDNVIINWN